MPFSAPTDEDNYIKGGLEFIIDETGLKINEGLISPERLKELLETN